MKKTYFFVFILLAQRIVAQYGIISDKDGFVNVRSEKSINGKIVDTFHNGRILYFLELDDEKSEWLDCTYTAGKGEKGGYIHKSRVKLVTDFKKIKPVLKKNQISFTNGQFKLNITVEKFVAKIHKLKWKKSSPNDKNSSTYLATIDNKGFVGCDGTIPLEQYGMSTIQFQGKTSILTTETFYNPNIDSHELYWDEKSDTYYLTTTNSDGAGGYVAMWVIKDGETKQRLYDIPF